MLDIQTKVQELAKVRADLMVQVNSKRFAPIESGLNALKDVLEFIDKEYVPHFESLNKGFVLRVGNGKHINYNVGYQTFVWFNGKHINVSVIEEILDSAKEEPQLWQRHLADYYLGIDKDLVDTNLVRVLLDKINETEEEIKLLEQELVEEEQVIEEIEEEEE